MSDLKLTSVRLRQEDLKILKKRAKESGIPWQTYLRVLVTAALKRKEVIV